MPNRASHAGHVPQRTCVVCRHCGPQAEKLRFVMLQGHMVFDLMRRLSGRGMYVCNDNQCIKGLDKWLRKAGRRRRKKERRES